MTLTFPLLGLPTLKLFIREADVATPVETTPEHDDAREERAFLQELMNQDPEACQSELGLMAMMTQYPRNF